MSMSLSSASWLEESRLSRFSPDGEGAVGTGAAGAGPVSFHLTGSRGRTAGAGDRPARGKAGFRQYIMGIVLSCLVR